MKKSFLEFLVLAGITMFVAGLFIEDGGGQQADGRRDEGSKEAGSGALHTVSGEEMQGKLQIAGSTSMERVTWALAEGFMKKYPDVTVSVECVGSSAGIEAVAAGRVQIGNSSRNLKEAEIKMGMVETVVAVDGIAVCVDPSNPVKEVTKEQLAEIYRGRIRNWQQVGGENMPIVVIGREAGSGTRNAFELFLELPGQCLYANELDSAGAVLARIASIPGAVGYISMAEADESVTPLKLDGVEATPGQVSAGRYPLVRPFVMITEGEITGQERLVQTWFAYVLGEEGQGVVEQMGLAGCCREEKTRIEGE